MTKVIIIGSGNVAQHLIWAFAKSKKAEVIQVFARNPETKIPNFDNSKITNHLSNLLEADVYIMALSDDVINSVSKALAFENKLVVHTSGSVAMTALDSKNRKGVFYPLQTFSKEKAVDFKNIPICIEAENPTDFLLLETIAKSISNSVYSINSNQRKALHVSAVFVNNFVNHLYEIGSEICQNNAIPFDILKPLIQETSEKIKTLSPKEAQTGPAKRSDLKTIAAHEAFLENENHKEIYKLLTKSIQENVKKL